MNIVECPRCRNICAIGMTQCDCCRAKLPVIVKATARKEAVKIVFGRVVEESVQVKGKALPNPVMQ